MRRHQQVNHPNELLAVSRQGFYKVHDGAIDWLASKAGSSIVFWACFIVPIIAIPSSTSVKLIVGLVFSNWYQAWALPAIQRKQERAEKLAQAKADVDHQALTHIAHTVDEIKRKVV